MAKRVSVYVVDSVAFMKANCMPAASTLLQLIEPCQCETSTPSAKARDDAAIAASEVTVTTSRRDVRRARTIRLTGFLRASPGRG